MDQPTIYLDNNATTQPLPEVMEAMRPFLRHVYANPSSIHPLGQSARHRVECAREQVATLVGGTPGEIVFTSGGTESINLAILGFVRAHPHRRRVVTTRVEHAATLQVMRLLERDGYMVRYVGVDGDGRLDMAEWSSAIDEETALVSLIHANNETGVVFDVARLSAIAAERGATVHIDAVQSAGKLPIDVRSWPVQLVSLSAHKFHGPKGAGALYVRSGTRIEPLIAGGGQERERRGGTENMAGIVGMGTAAGVAGSDVEVVAGLVGRIRDRLESGLRESVAAVRINGARSGRISQTTNVAFPGYDAQGLLLLLGEAGICASSGAACSSGSVTPSHVLEAMGLDDAIVRGSVRFSLSRLNTGAEIDRVLEILPGIVSRCPRAAAGKATVSRRP